MSQITSYLSPSCSFPVIHSDGSLDLTPKRNMYGRVLNGWANWTPDYYGRVFCPDWSLAYPYEHQHNIQGMRCPYIPKVPFHGQVDDLDYSWRLNTSRIRYAPLNGLPHWVTHRDPVTYYYGVGAKLCQEHVWRSGGSDYVVTPPHFLRTLSKSPIQSINYHTECPNAGYSNYIRHWNQIQEDNNGQHGASLNNIMEPNVAPYLFIKWITPPVLDDGSWIQDELPGTNWGWWGQNCYDIINGSDFSDEWIGIVLLPSTRFYMDVDDPYFMRTGNGIIYSGTKRLQSSQGGWKDVFLEYNVFVNPIDPELYTYHDDVYLGSYTYTITVNLVTGIQDEAPHEHTFSVWRIFWAYYYENPYQPNIDKTWETMWVNAPPHLMNLHSIPINSQMGEFFYDYNNSEYYIGKDGTIQIFGPYHRELDGSYNDDYGFIDEDWFKRAIDLEHDSLNPPIM